MVAHTCCCQSYVRLNAWLFPERALAQRSVKAFESSDSCLKKAGYIALSVLLTFVAGFFKPLTALISSTIGMIALPIMALRNHLQGQHYDAASKWMTWVLCFAVIALTASLIFACAMLLTPGQVTLVLGCSLATSLVATGVHLFQYQDPKALDDLPPRKTQEPLAAVSTTVASQNSVSELSSPIS